MFQNNMEEANSKKVEIEVSFIYTWCVQQIGIACSEGKNGIFLWEKDDNRRPGLFVWEGVLMLKIHSISTYSFIFV